MTCVWRCEVTVEPNQLGLKLRFLWTRFQILLFSATAHMGDWVSISLRIIQSAPTRWVLALFRGFMIFWSNAPKFRPIWGGMCILFEICEKRPFLSDFCAGRLMLCSIFFGSLNMVV